MQQKLSSNIPPQVNSKPGVKSGFFCKFGLAIPQRKMFRIYPNEKFKEVVIPVELQRRYAISSRGRFVSFIDRIEDGTLLRGSSSKGYRTIRYFEKEPVNNKRVSRSILMYKLVAEFFLPKPSEQHNHILHLDYQKDNDDVRNLKWATYEEMLEHKKNNPNIERARLERIRHNATVGAWKLTSTDVMLIKKLLANPERKTRLKIIAKRFGISQTHLKRIERGENWSHIKI